MRPIILYLVLIAANFSLSQTPCQWSDGNYRMYVSLVTTDYPNATFDKTDFMQRLQNDSNATQSQINFLDNEILEVEAAFPSSRQDLLLRTVVVTGISTGIKPVLEQLPLFSDNQEYVCEGQLSINILSLDESITFSSNPATANSEIIFSKQIENLSLSVFNLNGQVIMSKDLTDKNYIEIGSLNLKSGLHIFYFQTEDESATRRVLIR